MNHSQTFRGIAEHVSDAELRDQFTQRQAAALVYTPKRTTINPARLHQVIVDGKPTTGAGFSSEAWLTHRDAQRAARHKRAALRATWGDDAPPVTIAATTDRVVTVKQWIRAGLRTYRVYGAQRDGDGYSYEGVRE